MQGLASPSVHTISGRNFLLRRPVSLRPRRTPAARTVWNPTQASMNRVQLPAKKLFRFWKVLGKLWEYAPNVALFGVWVWSLYDDSVSRQTRRRYRCCSGCSHCKPFA
ncbi:hypothetical protein WJX74_007304 [Apatococcus lobatus]|uniref:Uncharacterized protein n=2 Tax=Apatococcus TaxID=904362 RepID=A0AAW1T2U7_9CHLO